MTEDFCIPVQWKWPVRSVDIIVQQACLIKPHLLVISLKKLITVNFVTGPVPVSTQTKLKSSLNITNKLHIFLMLLHEIGIDKEIKRWIRINGYGYCSQNCDINSSLYPTKCNST